MADVEMTSEEVDRLVAEVRQRELMELAAEIEHTGAQSCPLWRMC